MALYRALLPLFIYVCRSALGQSVVEVEVGAPSVTLPGTVRPLVNVPSALWTRGSVEVHRRFLKDDDFRKQNPLFTNRTQMNSDALESGNVSLELKGPTLTDSGTYTCVVREVSTEVDRFTVELRVKGLKLNVTEGSSVSLPFPLMRTLGSEVLVLWTFGSEEVHLMKDRKEYFSAQSGQFQGRTQMKPDALQRGDLSLELEDLELSDSGHFTCVVTEGSTELARTTVNLYVHPKADHTIYILLTTAIIFGIWLFLLALAAKRSEKKNGQRVIAFEGSSVSLPFHKNISESEVSVQWTLGLEEVHLKRGGADDFSAQSGRFQDRTQMKPDALQRRTLSLELKDLTLFDSGPYTCVVTGGDIELARTTVHLYVHPKPVGDPLVLLLLFGGLFVLLLFLIILVLTNESDPEIYILFGVLFVLVLLLLIVLCVKTYIRTKKNKESWKEAFVGVVTAP